MVRPSDRAPRPAGPGAALGVVEELEGYEAHSVPAFRAEKSYVCPTCAATIARGVGHVVAWPVGQLDARRHWHRHCWRLVARRGRIG